MSPWIVEMHKRFYLIERRTGESVGPNVMCGVINQQIRAMRRSHGPRLTVSRNRRIQQILIRAAHDWELERTKGTRR